jgi:hypothetical protein
MSAHRIHHDLYRGPKEIVDPGAGKTIHVNKDLQVCELVTAAAEARTLANPTKLGVRFLLRMKTDGGDATVTSSNGFNVAGNTSAVFGDVGDQLDLISVSHTSGYRWEILVNTGSVSLS